MKQQFTCGVCLQSKLQRTNVLYHKYTNNNMKFDSVLGKNYIVCSQSSIPSTGSPIQNMDSDSSWLKIRQFLCQCTLFTTTSYEQLRILNVSESTKKISFTHWNFPNQFHLIHPYVQTLTHQFRPVHAYTQALHSMPSLMLGSRYAKCVWSNLATTNQ